MNELVWTSEKPTQTGMYWFQRELGNKTIIAIEFFPDGTADFEMMGRDGLFPLDGMEGRWAGPIPQPKE